MQAAVNTGIARLIDSKLHFDTDLYMQKNMIMMNNGKIAGYLGLVLN